MLIAIVTFHKMKTITDHFKENSTLLSIQKIKLKHLQHKINYIYFNKQKKQKKQRRSAF